MANDPTPTMFSRRALLAAAAGGAALLAVPPRAVAGTLETTASSLPLLAPLPPGAPDRTLFVPLEQRYAGYLAILPAMTNDIEDGTRRGFMGGGWWRSPNAPYNARVQEHVYTLSWFHANQRPWNPYAGDAALAGRLDAALGHYLGLQHDDGSWPEYNPNEHALAATGFGLGYLAKTLANLRQSAALPQRRAEIERALHAGIGWLLNPANNIWRTPVEWTNQVAGGLAGSALALRLHPDAALAARLTERIDFLAEHGQSPAGFFYDPTGMDINYNFEVMLPEIAEIYLLTGNRAILEMARRFTEWFGYNLLREPDGSGWLTYYAVSARTSVAYYDNVIPDPDRSNLGSFFVPDLPELGAFFTSTEDRAAARAAWAAEPGPAPGLAKQDTSPRIIAHAPYGETLPSNAEKERAIAALPYLRRPEFAEVRRDTNFNQDYLYVKRPQLYFGAFFGTRPTSTVRSGPGFLWHPAAGTIVHAQQTDTGCWSTLLPNGNPDGRSNLVAEYQVGDREWDGKSLSPGSAPVRVRYRLPDSRITTELTVTRDSVVRSVRVTSTATEQIPLVLQPEDVVTFADGTPVAYGANATASTDGLTIRRGGTVITVSWDSVRPATVTSTSRTYLRDARRRTHMLRVPHEGRIEVRITLS
ncbi:hypothetical protein [Micromonospora sagamiensis]|uniref:Heparinase II/III-like protein n=1 Tax=Micromonospora sagamiensis TaxID=47875 RepID=A0A562WHZ2_9ACTN|nr:hypothetical protein [Micromonospora sagamiensis]TWJ29929.1 hypothetical protein JD81_03460 [Micromonospora sagamiensis]BCL17043.1 hypothetical protein GCM10017556_47820 [Micromonospora sagamiensis]